MTTEINPGEIIEAIRSGVTDAMPEEKDIIEAIHRGVYDNMPGQEMITETIYSGVVDGISNITLNPLWAPLPPGSHLRRGDNDEEGAEVVALRSRWGGLYEISEAMTSRGAVLQLSKDLRLRVGR